MNKRIITILMIFIMILSIGGSVFATGNTDTENAVVTEEENSETKLPDVFTINESEELDTGIPDVSIDDVTEWTDRKGDQIITMLQRFAQPFTIIIFIGCALLMLIGAFGDSRLISKGIYGMIIAGIVYAVVINANVIMDKLLGFLVS